VIRVCGLPVKIAAKDSKAFLFINIITKSCQASHHIHVKIKKRHRNQQLKCFQVSILGYGGEQLTFRFLLAIGWIGSWNFVVKVVTVGTLLELGSLQDHFFTCEHFGENNLMQSW
jgi:hypothetical protein